VAPAIRICSTVRRWHINESKIRKTAAVVLESLGLAKYHLDISFVGPRAMRTLNRTWRHKDKSTDVLSFPQACFPKPVSLKTTNSAPRRASSKATHGKGSPGEPLGDVIISLNDAARNAREDRGPIDREVAFLIVHGVLHLGGHDHEKPKEKKLMFGIQDQLMKIMTPQSGKPVWSNCVQAMGAVVEHRRI
jgi:probable rRNA maturation factor